MILVTGATGTVGRHVVAQLVAGGHPVKAFVTDEPAARRVLGPAVELVVGNFESWSSLDAALVGADRLFLLAPFLPSLVTYEANAIAAALRAGVKHVVKQSVMGAQADAGLAIPRAHRAGERLLELSSMAWTFVRPAAFMTNALYWVDSIRRNGAVYQPMGNAPQSLIDPRDIAAVAVAALTTPGHAGKAYDVTGPAGLTLAQQVAIVSEVIGKPIAYVDVPEVAARDAMLAMGMPAVGVDAMLELMARVRAGHAGTVTGAVQTVTGRAPRTFAAWARDHAAAFRP